MTAKLKPQYFESVYKRNIFVIFTSKARRESLFKKDSGQAGKTAKLVTNHRLDNGFTLLELIISIALIGIIVVIIAGTMRLASKSIDSGEKKMESLERMRASLNIIDSQIQSYTPLTYEVDAQRHYYFKGGRESMQFSTNFSLWGGEKGYVIATYTVKTGENGKQALYATENIVGMEGSRETKLLDTYERMYFEYFFKDPTEEKGRWIEQWTDTTIIPEKVKLHLIEGMQDMSLIIPFRVQHSMSALADSGLTVDEQ